jgi:hypothetical protein
MMVNRAFSQRGFRFPHDAAGHATGKRSRRKRLLAFQWSSKLNSVGCSRLSCRITG